MKAIVFPLAFILIFGCCDLTVRAGPHPLSAKNGGILEFVGCWSKGPCVAVAASGDTAYFNNGSWLQIVDFSLASEPALIGELLMASPMRAVSLQQEILYAACGREGIQIVDVSDPGTPRLLGFLDSCLGETPFARRMIVRGGIAYIANSFTGLWIVDVSDPLAPTTMSVLPLEGYLSCNDISLSGDLVVLAAGWEGRICVDVSSPTDPVGIAVFEMPRQCDSVCLDGNIAYVGNYFGFSSVDLTDPTKPVLLSESELDGGVHDVFMVQHFAYTLDDSQRKMRIFDVTDPAAPAVVNKVQLETSAFSLFESGSRIYLAHDYLGVSVFDSSIPSEPFEIGSYETYGLPLMVDVQGEHAYLLTYKKGLIVVDISDMSNPEAVGTYGSFFFVKDIHVDGDLVYVASSTWGRNLEIIDVTDPTAPKPVGVLNTRISANGVDIVDGVAYVTVAHRDLRIVDVSDPTAPMILGKCDVPYSPNRVKVQGRYAYVASGYGGLAIVDILNPLQPVLMGVVETSSSALDVDVVGDYAYTTVWYDGFHVADVSSPAAPQFVGGYDTRGNPDEVSVSWPHAFVADSWGGLYVLDVADPAQPRFVETFDSGGGARAVATQGGYVYVVDGIHGLVILRNTQAVPVHMTELSAMRSDGTVAVSWRARGVGADQAFKIWRSEIGSDRHVCVAELSGGLHEYIWHDRSPPSAAAAYRLQLVDPNGEASWLGEVQVSAAATPRLPIELTCHPNPFNPDTTIRYRLSEPTSVDLAVFDLLGKRVRTLVSGLTPAGAHRSIWDGTDASGLNMSSGIYLVRLRVGNQVVNQKVSLVK